MCISDFMGLQNRVGRSGIFFFANVFYCPSSEILENFDLKTSELLSKWSDLHIFFLYMIPNKIILSRTTKLSSSEISLQIYKTSVNICT